MVSSGPRPSDLRVSSGPRPLAFWVLSGGSTPQPERRFEFHGLERRLDHWSSGS
ncbi:unnamed protein product [Musa textilis]